MSQSLVSVGPGQAVLRDMPPHTGPGGSATVLAAGICGTDVELFTGNRLRRRLGPIVLGHENLVRIDSIDEATAGRWGVAPGQRVLVEEYVPCGHCPTCRSGRYRVCPQTDFMRPRFLRYGRMSADEPGPWGGFGETLYLHPDAWLHAVPDVLPDHHATLAVPLANAHRWLTRVASVAPGAAIVVIGPGIVGLAAVAVARACGAGVIGLSGLPADARRLTIGRELGADIAAADAEEVAAEIHEATDGSMADVVLDATGGAPGAGALAARVSGHGATVVLSGAPRDPDEALLRAAAERELIVRGVRGHDGAGIDAALRLLCAGRCDLADVVSAPVELSAAADMLAWLASPDADRPIHVSIRP